MWLKVLCAGVIECRCLFQRQSRMRPDFVLNKDLNVLSVQFCLWYCFSIELATLKKSVIDDGILSVSSENHYVFSHPYSQMKSKSFLSGFMGQDL